MPFLYSSGLPINVFVNSLCRSRRARSSWAEAGPLSLGTSLAIDVMSLCFCLLNHCLLNKDFCSPLQSQEMIMKSEEYRQLFRLPSEEVSLGFSCYYLSIPVYFN